MLRASRPNLGPPPSLANLMLRPYGTSTFVPAAFRLKSTVVDIYRMNGEERNKDESSIGAVNVGKTCIVQIELLKIELYIDWAKRSRLC